MTLADASYAINLYFVCGGFAYFSTYTGHETVAKSGMPVRKPAAVHRDRYTHSLYQLGHSATLVNNMSDYSYWLLHRGWALINYDFAETNMRSWLIGNECLESPFNTFTDIALASFDAQKHRSAKPIKQAVIDRDGLRCLTCGEELAENQATLHHVIPYSQGGETTPGNLVVLCSHCNLAIGTERLMHIYDLAGLPHSVEPSIMKGEKSREAFLEAIKLSSNMMYTRCKLNRI